MIGPERARIPWHLAGDEAVCCNCAWGCPCQFNAPPTRGHCLGLGAWSITDGYFGNTRLDGLRFAFVAWWPGAIHEGDGTIQHILDERASAEQRSALLALIGGEAGGAFFEIFAAVCPTRRQPLVAAIGLELDRARRVASVRIPGVIEARMAPIRNPVTGEEHRAGIVLPGGFEFREADVVNAVAWSSQGADPLACSGEGTHAHLASFDWGTA